MSDSAPERARHWDGVYTTKAATDVSWYQPRPVVSARLLSRFATPDQAVLDVGAGASALVDTLLDAGWSDVTVLDVSAAAVEGVRRRLADRPGASFVVADLLDWTPERRYDVWHDRAVFHFLVTPAARERYVRVASEAVREAGVVVVGAFATDGPTSCSGLPTARYDAQGLADAFGPAFAMLHTEREEHLTPSGGRQPFVWVVLRRSATPAPR